MSRRRRVGISAILFLVAVAYYLIAVRSSGGIPQSDVAKLEIELYPWLDDTRKIPGQSATVEDADRIAELLAALKSPELTKEHKCGSRGQIKFIRSNASVVSIEFLPGHHDSHYEFRFDKKLYRVPRAEFVRIMKLFGIDVPLDF
jgi:hypothetical protein